MIIAPQTKRLRGDWHFAGRGLWTFRYLFPQHPLGRFPQLPQFTLVLQLQFVLP